MLLTGIVPTVPLTREGQTQQEDLGDDIFNKAREASFGPTRRGLVDLVCEKEKREEDMSD